MKYSSPLVAVAVALLLQPFMVNAVVSSVRHEEEVINVEDKNGGGGGGDNATLLGFGKFKKKKNDDVDARFAFGMDEPVCQTLELDALLSEFQDTFFPPSNPAIIFTFSNPTVRDHTNLTVIVGPQSTTCIADALGDGVCNRVFSFLPLDDDDKFPNQIYVQTSVRAKDGIIIGGTGEYKCAFGSLEGEVISDPNRIAYVLSFCLDPACY
jgi:hypothetical protein